MEVSADFSESGGMEDNTLKCEEEGDSEGQKDDGEEQKDDGEEQKDDGEEQKDDGEEQKDDDEEQDDGEDDGEEQKDDDEEQDDGEDDGEEQRVDMATDKLREVPTAQSFAKQTTIDISTAATTAMRTDVKMEGTNHNEEVSEEDRPQELTATSVDTVTQEGEEGLIATSADGVPKEEEEHMTTSSTDVTKEEEEEQPMTTSVDDVTKAEEDTGETPAAVRKDPEETDEAESGGDKLDELMDMGTVDQEEQEAQMKDEEENTLDWENDGPTMRMDAVENESTLSLMGKNIKVVQVGMEEADDHRLQAAARPSRLPLDDGGPPSPDPVTVKDEHIDEEYNQALFHSSSSAPTTGIKDEPETPKELMISSVFSVEGRPGSARHASSPAPAAGRCPPPNALSVVCSLCKSFMFKGQTAYQKKGSTEIFCSPTCLAAKPQKRAARSCYHCSKLLLFKPTGLNQAAFHGGSVRDFCSRACFTASGADKGSSLKAPATHNCSVCKKPVAHSKHEVSLQGVTHRICNNTCFTFFRSNHKLNVSTCSMCGEYFASQILVLRTGSVIKNLCSNTCLAQYKERSTTSHPCSMCSTMTPLASTVDDRDSQGEVQIFCTTGCLLAQKIQSISSSGTMFPCNFCESHKIPAYHLAMSDSSIRNFCSLPCVLGFQVTWEKHHHKSPKDRPAASGHILSSQANSVADSTIATSAIAAIANPSLSLPPPRAGTTSTSTSTSTSDLTEATSRGAGPKPHCPVCDGAITSYPEVVQDKEKIVYLCGLECAEVFKTLHCSASKCEYCKLLKIPTDVKRIGSKNCSFCSEGCKLLYKHELSKQWGAHCRCCAYCFSISRSLVTTRYLGKSEEFCSESCRNKYSLLIIQQAACETCGTRGKLTNTLPLLGSPRRFCRLQCMLTFCSKKALDPQKSASPASTELESTPVIANVVSLASRPSVPPNSSPNVAEQGTAPSVHRNSLRNAVTQTSTARVPPPIVKTLKNKALLCRPMVQHKGTTFKPDTVDSGAQTDEPIRVVVVPIPVPVYVPVPMAMYSQYCPAPMTIPLPLPVPMMLPVTLDSAESVVETIRQIKERTPSDPLEADLLLMAEIVAEQEEQEVKEQLERREREGREGRGRGVRPPPPPEEREKAKEERGKRKKRGRVVEPEKDGLELLNEYINSYSSDLDPDIPDSLLDPWEDPPSAEGLLSDDPPLSKERLQPLRDVPVGPPDESPPQEPRPMDIEADMPVETLEQLEAARSGGTTKQPETKRRGPPGRRQRKARDKKRGGQAAEVSEASRAPRLQSQYGIDAWERWVRWRRSQPDLQTPRINGRALELKEDVLRCTTTELSYGLCRFVMEVKRPSGEPYLPDSLFYLCLGIQKHLFENSRVENIFTDVFYNKFSMEITKLLKDFKPSISQSGYIHSRVEEEYLWDCKQLGAYSPIVLLNTLLFFCSKFLGFTSVRQHSSLSFAHFMRCSRTNANNSKTIYLRFYPPVDVSGAPKQKPADSEAAPAKRSRQDKDKMLAMVENQENPLRCPVRLYEFYLSKCSETVKQRSNVFYLRPERSCVPNSPLWFSGTPLDEATLGGMLTRILSVREMHLQAPPSDDDEATVASPGAASPSAAQEETMETRAEEQEERGE